MRLCLLLLLMPAYVSAGPRLMLVWDVSRTASPPIVSFRITITDLAAQQQDHLTVEPSQPGVCGPGTTDDTFCAQLPSCPPPGVYGLFVQAMQQGATMTTDEDANQQGIICQVLESAPCQCAPTTAAQLPTTAATTPAVVASNTASPTSTTGTLSTFSTMQLPTLPTVPPLDAMTT